MCKGYIIINIRLNPYFTILETPIFTSGELPAVASIALFIDI